MKTLPMFNLAKRIRRARIMTALLGMCALGASLLLLRNQASARSRKEESPYAVLATAPEKARERKNPLAADPDAVVAGRKLFEQHCVECHGQTAGGTMRGANLRRDEVQQATPGTLFWVLTNGIVRRGMPVWSKLPEPQRWQIVTYLKSLNIRPSQAQSSSSATENVASH
ncbi:MAG TPA: c-type cytochrome [Terriglobales bacterium]|nr:c-type cytochrome [Terriglobales bacterium]